MKEYYMQANDFGDRIKETWLTKNEACFFIAYFLSFYVEYTALMFV